MIEGLDGHISFRQLAESVAIICAPGMMTGAEIAAFASANSAEDWSISEAKHFPSGDSNPSPCPGDPARVHYLLSC